MSGSRLATATDPLTGSLASQLDLATPILLANNWVTKPQLDHLRAKVLEANLPVTVAGRTALAQFLIDQRLMPRDQIIDLDSILKSQVHLPQFQLQKKVGSGGMGTVFLALHRETNRLVALKTMNAKLADDKDFIERFHREARSLEAAHNPHIAEIIATGETDGTCWLAMEYIEGPSLMKLLKEHRALPEAYAINIAKQLAEGLGHVWEKARLVHRDLKPENVLVVRAREGDDLFPLSDVAKLIDFGLVKSNNDDDRLTQTGMTIGTPLYMSPEQVRGEKLDCRSDMYGLGATLYHLLTGGTPFSGNSPGAIMSAHLTEAVPDPGDRVPSLNKYTRELVMTAMAKEVNGRYRDFTAFAEACQNCLDRIEHKSTSIPKLLRKPLVIKPPTKPKDSQAKSATTGSSTETFNRQAPTVVAPSARPQALPSRPPSGSINRPTPDAGQRPISTMVSRPPTGSLDRTQPTPRPGPELTSSASAPRPVPSTGPLPPIGSGSSRHQVSTSTAEGISPHSAAFVEPMPSPGVGMLPWLALGFAVLALVVFLVLTYA